MGEPGQRMGKAIAIFDYKITATNPAGSCHLRMLRELCQEHTFTVFAVEFENPCPERIGWVRIPAPMRPLALLFVVYHLLAPLAYAAYRLRHRVSFDIVQSVESNLSFGQVVYSHFSHLSYLKRHWRQSRARGMRGRLRWLDHRLHAFVEPWVYHRARFVVVPSRGLARELVAEFPEVAEKIVMLPNPVDLERMDAPSGFDRDAVRQDLGIGRDDIVLIFVALGQFERKGLPLVFEALTHLMEPRLKLVVVGGEADLVAAYRDRASREGVGHQVVLVGMQRDIRPYLWAGDAFVLPSFYEVFPLVALEAAAARLPLIVTPLNGVEEVLRDGVNGILVDRSGRGVAEGLARFLSLHREEWLKMGERARQDVKGFDTANFGAAWREFYASA